MEREVRRNAVAPPIGGGMFWTLPIVTGPLGNELHKMSERVTAGGSERGWKVRSRFYAIELY